MLFSLIILTKRPKNLALNPNRLIFTKKFHILMSKTQLFSMDWYYTVIYLSG